MTAHDHDAQLGRPRHRRRLGAVALSTGLLFTLGVAFAQWTATGTGSGYGKATTAQTLSTVDASATASPDLYPGGTGSLTLHVSNPNAYPVTVTGVAGSGTITSSTSGCGSSDHHVTFAGASGLRLAVPAGGSATHVIPDVLSMGVESADTCQGAAFAVPVSLTGNSGSTPVAGGDGTTTYYADADSDGFGNPSVSTSATSPPSGYVQNNTDCDDANASVYPGATEVLDGVDNDCDGVIDDGAEVAVEYAYRDADGDGHGDPNNSSPMTAHVDSGGSVSYTADEGYILDNTDCNDGDASIYPGAIDTVSDGIDQDCDGSDG